MLLLNKVDHNKNIRILFFSPIRSQINTLTARFLQKFTVSENSLCRYLRLMMRVK